MLRTPVTLLFVMVVTSCHRLAREFRTVRGKGLEQRRTDGVERNADQSRARRGITSPENSANERSASSSVIVPRNR